MKYILTILLTALILPACANSPGKEAIDDKANLQAAVMTFHRDMRWQRWESAAMMVAPEERQKFLGRYEQLGEDFSIIELDLKSVSQGENAAIIDVQQQSMKEPSMVVKKERIIEVWEKRDSAWLLTERMEKDEYKEKMKTDQEEAAKKKDAPETETPREDQP
ncbi:MAG: hypothetical protein ACOC9W_03140 [Persicimonas sp.]